MSAALVLAAAVAASTAAVSVDASSAPAVAFDAANYPRKALAALRREEPCPKARSEFKDVLFSAETRWHGAVRRTPPARMAMISEWTREIGDPDAAPKYAEEATFAEGGRFEWVAVPEGLLAYLQMDLQAGDRVLLFLVLTGCAEGTPVWVVDEYEVPEQTPLEGDDELIYRLPAVDGEHPGVLGPGQPGVLEGAHHVGPLRAPVEQGPRVAVDGQRAQELDRALAPGGELGAQAHALQARRVVGEDQGLGGGDPVVGGGAGRVDGQGLS